MHITSENQNWTHKPSEGSQCSHHLCSFIAAYIYLDTFAQSLFCNLRKPLPRCCIHIFLAADRADLGRDLTNDNGCLTSGKGDRRGSWFSFSILADHALHGCFLLVFISDSHFFRVGSYVVMIITCCWLLFSAATIWIGRPLHRPSSNFAGNGNAWG